MNTATKTTISMITAAAAALTLVSAPSFASAHDSRYYRDHHRYEARQRSYDSCRSHRKSGKTTGAIVGAIGGGLLGNSLSHGNRTPGTLLGAGAGAYAGSQIGKGHRC